MNAAASIVVLVTAAANIGMAVADLFRARFVLATSADVDVPAGWVPLLGVAKGAGGVGLLLWFAGLTLLPALAAAGLVCFFVGADVAHVRARRFGTLAFPSAYLALAVASLCVVVAAP